MTSLGSELEMIDREVMRLALIRRHLELMQRLLQLEPSHADYPAARQDLVVFEAVNGGSLPALLNLRPDGICPVPGKTD